MPDSAVAITAGSGTSIDTRTEDTNSQHRQVIVVGGPSVNAAVAEVASVDPGATSTSYGQVVRLAGSATIVGTLTGITNTVGVFFDRANPAVSANYGSGTFLVAFDRANPSVSIGGASTSIGVFFDRANPAINLTSGTLTSITNTVGVFFDRANPAVNLTSGTLTSITNTVGVYFDRANPTVTLGTNSGVDIGDVDILTVVPGSGAANLGKAEDAPHTTADVGVMALAVRNDAKAALSGTNLDYTPIAVSSAGEIMISDPAGTAIVYRTAQGTASSAGGAGLNTVVSAEASRNIKVYAYTLTTTAQVGIVPRFSDGSSASGTTFWRIGAMQAPSQGIAGANLAVTPPAYLFATGAGVTLALYLDSASLVHYSVAYFKESG